MNVVFVGISSKEFKMSDVHSHMTWEILVTLTGTGVSEIDGARHDFFPGSIECIPPLMEHSKASENGVFTNIHMRLENLPSFEKNAPALFADDESGSVESLMFMALRFYYSKENGYCCILDSLADTIEQILLSWQSHICRNEYVEALKNDLTLNYANLTYKVTDAMAKIPYCPDHFRKCFKNDVGMTPLAYLNGLRIEHAKKLLRQRSVSNLNVEEISYLSGFFDSNYFARLFKKRIGMTPVQYYEQSKNPV